MPGYSQAAMTRATVALMGAGGIGTEVGEGLTRKGVGSLTIFDPDVVEETNLNRQLFFTRDLKKNKALRLAKNLSQVGFLDTQITGYGVTFEEAVARGIDLTCDVAVVGVDSSQGRIAASRFYYRRNTPVVFTAVNEAANFGYVFVQKPGAACFACLFPKSVEDASLPCPGVPAVKDILKVVAGIVLYAVDSLLMPRPRPWNYKTVFLDAAIPGQDWAVARRPDCRLCQEGQRALV